MNKDKRIGRKLLCLVVSLVMVCTLIPHVPGGFAYAEDLPEEVLDQAAEPATDQEVVSEEETAPAEEETLEEEVTAEEEVPAEEEVSAEEAPEVVEAAEEQPLPLEAVSEHFKATVTYGPEAGVPEGAYLVLTEFAEGSTEYEETKAALVADEEGNSVYSQTSEEEQENLGMAAFDLTIYDAEGNPVEPTEGVAVNIEVLTLPEGANAEALADTMEIQHLNESTGDVVVEKVATVNSEEAAEVEGISEIAVDTEQETAAAEFAVDGFSTFVFTWTDNDLREHVIVHYVDVNGNEIQGTQTSNVTVGNSAVNFSTYEGGVSGYTFKEARIDDPKTGAIVTGFTPSSSGNTLTFTYDGTSVRAVERPYNTEVYFIYTPNDAPPGGDVPSIDEPATEKLLERQNDGTYDITLKIKGEAASTTTETRANIVVVYDSSNSMSDTDTTTKYIEDENGMWGQLDNGEYVQLRESNIWMMNGTQYTGYRYLAGTGNNYNRGIYNGNVIQLYRNGNTWYRTRTGNQWTGYNYSNPYTGTRYERVDNNSTDTSHNLGFDSSTGQMVELTRETELVYGNGQGTVYTGEKRFRQESTTQTRHEIAKAAVTSLANQLFEFNKDNPQMIQMALVDFGTMVNTVDGASFTLSGNTLTPTVNPTTDKATFLGWLDGVVIPDQSDTVPDNLGGTDWEEALKVANLINFGDTDPTYIIFVSDGAPTYRVSQNGHNDGSNSRTSHNRTVTVYGTGNSDNSNWNLDAAVVEAKNILAANKELYTVGAFVVTNNKLPNLGGNDYDASDSAKLNQAFSDIVDSITNALNVANVNITDGLTALTASTFVSGEPDPSSFRYTKGGEAWAPESEGAENATVVTDENGNQSVVWAMGEDYLLEKNVEYTVTFTVWPKQDAYDILAALNNGILEWGDDYTYEDADGNTVTIPAEDTEDGVKGYKSQIVKNGDIYTVLTNTSAGATYQEVSFVDGEEVGRTDGSVDIANPTEGMGLDESYLDVKKE